MNEIVTPNTAGYLLMGLAMIAVIIGAYAFTLAYRLRIVQHALDKASVSE
jgi:hypothetical protein